MLWDCMVFVEPYHEKNNNEEVFQSNRIKASLIDWSMTKNENGKRRQKKKYIYATKRTHLYIYILQALNAHFQLDTRNYVIGW